jgi:hypothetical protein
VKDKESNKKPIPAKRAPDGDKLITIEANTIPKPHNPQKPKVNFILKNIMKAKGTLNTKHNKLLRAKHN